MYFIYKTFKPSQQYYVVVTSVIFKLLFVCLLIGIQARSEANPQKVQAIQILTDQVGKIMNQQAIGQQMKGDTLCEDIKKQPVNTDYVGCKKLDIQLTLNNPYNCDDVEKVNDFVVRLITDNNNNSTDDEVQKYIDNTFNSASNTCRCCDDPTRCFFKTPAGLTQILTGMGVAATAVGMAGGHKKICQVVAGNQTALATLNATAGAVCATKGSKCMSSYKGCKRKVQSLIQILSKIQTTHGVFIEQSVQKSQASSKLIGAPQGTTVSNEIPSCFRDGFVIKVKTKINAVINLIKQQQKKINKAGDYCADAKKNGGLLALQSASNGLAAFIANFCAKEAGGGNVGWDDDDPPDNSDDDKCVGSDCVFDPNVAEDDSEINNFVSEQDLKTGTDFAPGLPNPEEPGVEDLTSLDEGGQNSKVPTFLPPGWKPSQKEEKPSGTPLGGTTFTKSGSGGAGGGGLGLSGGGSGSYAPSPEGGARKPVTDPTDKYKDLLSGLSGKTNKNSGLSGGDSAGGFSNEEEQGFNLKDFLPKFGKKEAKEQKARDLASQQKVYINNRSQNIFDISSKVTRSYCSQNSVNCVGK